MASADTQRCITQYMLDAPGDPTGYPCGTCLPLLVAVPTNASSVYTVSRDGTQSCGLRSIWEDAGQQDQAGWRTSSSVRGAACDAISLVACCRCMFPLSHFFHAVFHRNPSACRQLSFPAIPASLLAQFTNLTDRESLAIAGNGNSPGMAAARGDLLPNDVFIRRPVAGSFPTSFGASKQSMSLHLENTALGAFSETFQNLTSLSLIRNVQLGSSLSPNTDGRALQSLYVVELCRRHSVAHCFVF